MSLGTRTLNWRQAALCDCWRNPGPGGREKGDPHWVHSLHSGLVPCGSAGHRSLISVAGVWLEGCLLNPLLSALEFFFSLGHEPGNQAYQLMGCLFFHRLFILRQRYRRNRVCSWSLGLQVVEASDLLLLCFLRMGERLVWVAMAPNTRQQ